jgi:FixJ family two-component response regulator
MSEPAIVYVVDDDPGMRKSLGRVMESAQLAVKLYESADQFLADYTAMKPPPPSAMLVLDMQMPGMHGVELLRSLRQQNVHLPVVVVTGTGTVPIAVESMKLGVVDFLEKPVDHRTLLNRVEQGLARDAARRVEITEANSIRQRLTQLTAREREVLELIIRGRSNKQIAMDLDISIKTVAIHRANVMSKSGAVNTADLVRMSMIANAPDPKAR